jgi:hypothetical protein
VWLGFLVHGLEYAFHLLYFLFALSIPGFYLYFNRKYHPAKEPSSIKDKILGWLLGSIFLLIVFGIPAVLWYFFGLPLLLKN